MAEIEFPWDKEKLAFPVVVADNAGRIRMDCGMTLREYYAGLIMAQRVSTSNLFDFQAKMSVEAAEALIKNLEKVDG